MLRQLDLRDVELAVLLWAITNARVSNVLLVLVKLLQSIFQVLDRSV